MALANERLVETFGPGGRYRLGPDILRMAEAARAGLVSEAHSLLQDLSIEIQETVDLAILDKNALTFVDQVVAPQRLRAVSGVGLSFPLYCTANGKALLAALPAKIMETLLPRELAALTPNTITSLERLHKELRRVRERGYALDEEEHSVGICAVGVAIGQTPLGFAAVSVPMPVQRFEEKRERAAKALRVTATAIAALWTGVT